MKAQHLQSRSAPFSGVRVVELGTVVAGPFAGSLLADLGADVIKVEPPRGDILRRLGPQSGGVHLWWGVSSRDKRCIALNLKSGGGAKRLRALLSQADILISNYRPGVLERLGFGPRELTHINPRLIHAKISGFGSPGPDEARPGFGKIAEAMSGLAYLTGSPDDQPLFCGFSLADTMAGLFAALGATFALYGRDNRGGLGRVVDVPLYEPLLRILESQFINLNAQGNSPARRGSNDPYGFGRADAPGRIVSAADRTGRQLAIYIPTACSARRCAEAIGHSDLSCLNEALLPWCALRSAAEVHLKLSRSGASVGPVLDGLSAGECRYFLARSDVQWVHDSAAGSLVVPGHIEPLNKGDERRTFRSAELQYPDAVDWSPRAKRSRTRAQKNSILFSDLLALEITDTPGAAFSASCFADFGARVFICESENGGSPLRRLSPNLWTSLARNKRSVAVGERRASLFKALLSRADIVFTDVAERQWCDHPLLSLLPDAGRPLIVSVFPTGADLPELWEWDANSALAGAASGLMAITGWAEGPPVLPEVPLSDYAAGALAALRAAARLWRYDTVRDDVVSEPLHRAFLRMIEWQLPVAASSGEPPLRQGNCFPMNMGVGQMWRTRDGRYVTVSAVGDEVIKRLLRLVGGEALLQDSRFATSEQRARHSSQISGLIGEWVSAYTAEEIIRVAIKEDVVAGAVLNAADLLADPHVRARKSVIDISHARGPQLAPAPVPRIEGWQSVVQRPGPALDDGVYDAFVLSAIPPDHQVIQ